MQKWYQLEKVPKITNKNGTILEQGGKSETTMVPLEKCTENLNLKWYHSRRVPKIRDNNGTIPENEKIPLPDKNSTIPDEYSAKY